MNSTALIPGKDGLLAGNDEPMDAHRAIRAAQGRMDNLCGASSVYAQACDHHRQVINWLHRATSSAERACIAALAADTCGFVGFLTYDQGMTEMAAGYYLTAADHAQAAGDLSVAANLLGQYSRVAADQGRLTEALTIADRALHVAGTLAHPAVRSWLHAVRAHHHAALTHVRSADTDIRAAWKLLETADDGEMPPYIGYLDMAEIQKWVGHAMVRLGTSTPGALRRGREALDFAHASWPTDSVRGAAEMLTSSASIYLDSGEREAADSVINAAVTIAQDTGSARNLRDALAVRTRMAAM